MTINKKILAGVLCSLSIPVYADVTLQLPNEVKILSINGLEGKKNLMPFITSSQTDITLPNGTNQIVYDVSKVYNKGSSQATRYQSSPIVLTFDSSDSTVSMHLPELPTYESTHTFEKKPSVTLKNNKNESINYSNEKLPISGFSFSNDYTQLLNEYNNNKKISTQNNPNPTKLTQSTPNIKVTKTDILKDAFSGMTPQEKQDFLSWAINNLN